MNRERQFSVQKAVPLRSLQLPEDLSALSVQQCIALSSEIRSMLIATVLQTGGHLASNLGVVELTIALHRNFHSPEDKLVWDVGHQAYVHKLLTGRADQLPQLRQEGGLAGFPKPAESPHDSFITGHSSTAVSAAFGMAEAMRQSGDTEHHAIAVVGDGAMTGGMFYEGLNNAGKSRANLIVVLNDNAQAISKNVGSIAKYLSKIRRSPDYVRKKWGAEKVLKKAPAGDKIVSTLKKSKDKLRANIMQTNIFEELGFVYLGPVDGHNIEELDETLTVAKSYRRPVLVHVNTVKGKGYAPAEKNPGEYHGVPRSDPADIDIDLDAKDPELSIGECFSNIFGQELSRLAEQDARICAVTAAMKYGTGLQFFCAEHPERFYDVGIAEEHAVTFCAALASMGKLPVFAVYSTFLQRGFDQLLHDTAIAGYHTVLGIDRAGLVGEDGETHQGIYDVPMLTTIPGCKIYSPATYEEVRLCLNKALYEDSGLTAVRYPKGTEPGCEMPPATCEFTHIPGKDVLLITYGRLTEEALLTIKMLKEEGISCGLLKLTAIFPLEREIIETVKQYDRAYFFEEGGSAGGIGEKLASILLNEDYRGGYRCRAIEGFVQQANIPRSLLACGLDAASMAEALRELCR